MTRDPGGERDLHTIERIPFKPALDSGQSNEHFRFERILGPNLLNDH